MKKYFYFFICFLFSFINYAIAITLDESFESDNLNWLINSYGNGGAYSIENGYLVLEVNGGSDGYMGKGDSFEITLDESLNLQNSIVEFNIEEIVREQIDNNKENISFYFKILSSDKSSSISVYFSGMHSGYHPDLSGWDYYNIYHGHRFYIYEYLDGTNSRTETIELNTEIKYNFDFKFYYAQDHYVIEYKDNQKQQYNTIHTNFNQYENVNLQFGIGSGDGGYTRKNGYGKFRTNYLKIYPSTPDCITQSERDALIDLFNSTNGQNWNNNLFWLGNQCTECSWYGVSCDESKHIISLHLYSNNLNGEIPSTIKNLIHLKSLILHNNKLTGNIPIELFELEQLESVTLNDNNLSNSLISFTKYFIQEQLNNNSIVWDIFNDGKKGIPEAIDALKHVSGFYSKEIIKDKVLFESSSLSGVSKAILYNDEIAMLFTENAGHPQGYPDSSDFSNLNLLVGESIIAIDDTGRSDCAFSSDLVLTNDNRIAIAYQKWAGYSYAFDSPYKIFDGSSIILDQLIFDDANWGYYTTLDLNISNNVPHVIQFGHSGYFLNYSTNSNGSWTNTNISGNGIYYSYPTLKLDKYGKPHVLTSQLSNDNGILKHWYINSSNNWESETIASDSNGHGNIEFNDNTVYAIYVNKNGNLILLIKENENWRSEIIDTGFLPEMVYRNERVKVSLTGDIYSVIQTDSKVFAYKKQETNWQKIEVHSELSLETNYRYGSKPPTILSRSNNIIVVYADKSKIYATTLMFR